MISAIFKSIHFRFTVYIADALVSTAEVIKLTLRILDNNLSVAQRELMDITVSGYQYTATRIDW